MDLCGVQRQDIIKAINLTESVNEQDQIKIMQQLIYHCSHFPGCQTFGTCLGKGILNNVMLGLL